MSSAPIFSGLQHLNAPVSKAHVMLFLINSCVLFAFGFAFYATLFL